MRWRHGSQYDDDRFRAVGHRGERVERKGGKPLDRADLLFGHVPGPQRRTDQDLSQRGRRLAARAARLPRSQQYGTRGRQCSVRAARRGLPKGTLVLLYLPSYRKLR